MEDWRGRWQHQRTDEERNIGKKYWEIFFIWKSMLGTLGSEGITNSQVQGQE